MCQEILSKIAYCYYEKFRDAGFPEDNARDWRYAKKAYNHLVKPPDPEFDLWNQDEVDYGEFRKFLGGQNE